MHILVFAGTQDGSQIARMLCEHQIEVDVCVATEYGEECLRENFESCVNPQNSGICDRNNRDEHTSYLHCHTGRLTTVQMEELMQQNYAAVIDATHPFATKVSACIKEACSNCGLEYIRFSRESGETLENNAIRYVDDITEASQLIKEYADKRILFTTGSKDIKQLTGEFEEKKNLYVRVLPAMESLKLCEDASIPKKQIIAMQGPFSMEMNLMLIKEFHIDLLVTKESGVTGGYPEKLNAAREADIETLVIRNPEIQKSYNWVAFWDKMSLITGKIFDADKINITNNNSNNRRKKVIGIDTEEANTELFQNTLLQEQNRNLTIIGIGPGDASQLTQEAVKILNNADLIFGAETILSHVSIYNVRKEPMYQKDKILSFLEEHQEYRNPVLIVSGDVGFYSGAASFHGMQTDHIQVSFLPGISSMIYFCAKLGLSWQDVAITSIHGREANVIGKVRTNKKVFVLVSGREDIISLNEKLIRYDLGNCKLSVGYQLSTPEEKIFQMTSEEVKNVIDNKSGDFLKDGLYVLLIENDLADNAILTPGISDDDFIRGKVPMTKEEVREVSIAKLHLQKNSILYDIGAGTGSISIEAARIHDSIKVYAIEKNLEAIELLHQNKDKFAVDNVEIIEGTAPEAFEMITHKPTHAFIGGSSGNLSTILKQLMSMNPQIRIVINTVTLETLSEVTELLKEISHKEEDVTQLSVTKTRQVGAYHLMQAANPVMIISFTGDSVNEK